MKNQQALDFFRNKAQTEGDDPLAVKISAGNDFTDYDAQFILRYASPQCELLDLGSGSGMTVNRLRTQMAHITAVEPFAQFSRHIVCDGCVEVVNSTIGDFLPARQYDLITLFGVMQYFDEQETADVYAKYLPWLRPGGRMIVKNQFGVHEDVVVSGWSEELKTNYHSFYHHLDKAVAALRTAGFSSVEVHDIYPPECNRWDNTHFYALVATK